ncbi:hypothetical protein OIV83_000109 [Microbotryomycetes sp. JL201]|nr:hypothetical protein OIV83_000109 [Microbotryomycetes sp. JL201]
MSQSQQQPQTIIFKTVNGLDLAIDVYHAPGASEHKPAPILLWYHGGGLLQGTRKACWPHLKSAPHKHGLTFISADYRLAPQVRLPDILSDVADCIKFIHSAEFSEKTGRTCDPSKLIISGGSAGGWLALLGGMGIGYEGCNLVPPPKPLAICAIYPISDLLDPFWTNKQTKASYFPRRVEANELEQYLNPESTVVGFSEATSPRSNFYHYMIQEGILAHLLLDGTGIDPSVFSVAQAIKTKQVENPPPTYLVHGTIDDKVPIVQASDVAETLEQVGAQVSFDVLEGKDHLFDMDENETMENMYAFIGKCLS